MNQNWTDEMDATLADMRKGGFSSSQIAAHFNRDLQNGEPIFTRNAVVGRAYRLVGKGKLDKIESTKGIGKYARSDAPKLAPVSVAPVRIAPSPPPERQAPLVLSVVPETSQPQPIATGVTLAECTGCRFPVNAPAEGEKHLFCNADPKPGKPYCEVHCAVAYQPKATPRVKRKFKAYERQRF